MLNLIKCYYSFIVWKLEFRDYKFRKTIYIIRDRKKKKEKRKEKIRPAGFEPAT